MKIKYYLLLTILLIVMIFALGCTTSQQKPDISSIEKTSPSEIKDLNSETDNTEIEPVEETLSFSWAKDSGSRIVDGSVPFIHKLNNGKVRLYYCKDNGILSAISNDGLTFTKEQGVRVSPGTGFETIVCDPTVVNLPDGKMRMYYKGA